MKLSELVFYVIRRTRTMRTPPEQGEIIAELNLAQDHIAWELKIPRRLVEITYSGGYLSFSEELREGGIINVDWARDRLRTSLEVVPVGVANQRYANWQTQTYDGTPAIVVQDVGTTGLVSQFPVLPRPGDSEGTFYALYACKTVDMSVMESHEPFAYVESPTVGAFPSLHRAVGDLAVSILNPNDRMAPALYEKTMNTASPLTNTGAVAAKNLAYRQVMKRR